MSLVRRADALAILGDVSVPCRKASRSCVHASATRLVGVSLVTPVSTCGLLWQAPCWRCFQAFHGHKTDVI